MTIKSLHPQASWLYGVVVALAIREGLSSVIPAITSPTHLAESWALRFQAPRLIVFLLTLIRFFLGSVHFFNEVHVEGASYKRKNYGFDFTVGLIHFLCFFVWATTIVDIKHWHAGGLSHFVLVGTFVLLYDVLWLIMSLAYDTVVQIAPWAVINFATVVLCAIFFLPYPADSVFKEQMALGVVIFIGVIDTLGIISNRNLIAEFIARVFSLNRPAPAPSPAPITDPSGSG